MHLGFILATEGVPSSDRLANSASIYAFLSMKNPSLLLGEGRGDIIEPQNFVASIQWFLTDLFGIKRDSIIFMYHAITILRRPLESSTLAQA